MKIIPKPEMSTNTHSLALFCALLVGGLPCALPAAPTNEPAYEVISNASGFSCLIPGCPDASKNIREIAIDELNIDVREMTTGLDVEYRRFQPGQPIYGNATFTCALGGSKELQAWFQEVAKGKNIRKNITVTLFKSDKTPGRSYSLIGCLPISWSSSEPDPSGAVQTETLTVKIGRIEFSTRTAAPPPGRPGVAFADATTSDKFAQVRGFKVEISGSSGKEVDTAWESVSGGHVVVPLLTKENVATGAGRFTTFSPGHKSVGEITLRGAMTDGRKNLCTWINDTVNGKPWKRMLTVTEILSQDGSVKPGKQYNFHDCFPIRYVFPRMSVTNTTGNVREEITVHEVRIDRNFPALTTGRITIPDAPAASAQAPYVAVEDMGMDVGLIPTTGDARDQSAVIVVPEMAVGELQKWMDATAQGVGDPRTITIDLYQLRRFTGRQLILWDCLPQSITPVKSPGGTMEEVTVKPIRVELK